MKTVASFEPASRRSEATRVDHDSAGISRAISFQSQGHGADIELGHHTLHLHGRSHTQ